MNHNSRTATTARVPVPELPPALGLTVTTTADDAVVAVAGEIDATCSDELLDCLGVELAVGTKALIADLTAVPFCSSGGLSVLLEIRARAAEQKVPFVLVTEQRGLLRPISLLHLDTILTIHPTVAAARTALGTASP